MTEELLVDAAAAESDLQAVCEADDECAGCVRGYAAEEEGDGACDARGGAVGSGGDYGGGCGRGWDEDCGGGCRRGDDWYDG